MKLYIEESKDILFEMSNMRGKYVKNPHRLNFSFYFSTKDAVESKDLVHGLRVKPVFNPEKIISSKVGTLKLHSDWEYIPGNDDKDVSSKDINAMKDFFKTYKVLFAAVWEKVLEPDALYDYFRGIMDFNDIKQELDFYNEYKEDLDKIDTLTEFTEFVKQHHLFNLWEN